MDYKEKYNTIIERAKTAYNGTCKYKGKDLIEYLLNGVEEINESEDEKIRKAIINVFAAHKDYEIFFGVSVEDILFYLAKQKEQPTNEEMLRTLRAEYEKGVADTIAKYEQKEQKHSLNFDTISSWLRDHASRYVNGEFNEFHHCVEYDGTIDVERLIADLKVAVDAGTFDVDAAFDTRKPRDNWEYIKEFCDKFGRIPKDIDELDALVSYVMDKKQKEQKYIEDVIKNITKNKEAATTFLKSAGIMDDNGELAEMYRSEQSILDSALQKIKRAITNCKKLSEHYKDTEENFHQYYGGKAEGLQLALAYFGNENEQSLEECVPDSVKFNEGFKTGREVGFREGAESVKPTEWGESEMKALDSIIDDYEKANKSFCGYDGKIMLLKAIRDGEYDLSKQEWGDEDEKTIDEAVEYIEKYAEHVQGGYSKQYVLDLARRVDSLRPQSHWKPSEEQVKAIDLAIRFVTDDFDEHPTLSETLRELYNDLKKL